MNLRRSFARVALPLLLAVSTGSALGQDLSASDFQAKKFAEGTVGLLSIGMKISQIELHLRRSLELRFAGDGRAGVSFEKSADLQELRVLKFLGVTVEVVDVLFKSQGNTMYVEFISLGVPCANVSNIQTRLSTLREQPQAQQATPTSSALAPRRRYVGGAEKAPACRVWLREA